MIRAICPASCGELLQGWVLGGEKLISYSIDCYTMVTLGEGKPLTKNKYQKSYQMIDKVLEFYNINKGDICDLNLEIRSEIPVGKGMASSTADLAATALATATYLGKEIFQEEIASLCVEIEPTDSTVFSEITLFDHLEGKFKKSYGTLPSCDLLLLEGKQLINTIDFRQINRNKILIKQENILKKSLEFFEAGVKTQDLKQIGRAATLSAMANQSILYKDGLEDMVELADKMGALGVNIAHSGSVIGILHLEKDFDRTKFIHRIQEKVYWNNYINISKHQLIAGGAKISK